MMKQCSLNDKLANWVLLLSLYDMLWPQKAMKGQAIANFPIEYLIQESSKLHEDIPEKAAEAIMVSKEQV